MGCFCDSCSVFCCFVDINASSRNMGALRHVQIQEKWIIREWKGSKGRQSLCFENAPNVGSKFRYLWLPAI